MLHVKYATGLLPRTNDRARFENRRQHKRIVLTMDNSDNEPPCGGFFLYSRFSSLQRKERDSIARIVSQIGQLIRAKGSRTACARPHQQQRRRQRRWRMKTTVTRSEWTTPDARRRGWRSSSTHRRAERQCGDTATTRGRQLADLHNMISSRRLASSRRFSTLTRLDDHHPPAGAWAKNERGEKNAKQRVRVRMRVFHKFWASTAG